MTSCDGFAVLHRVMNFAATCASHAFILSLSHILSAHRFSCCTHLGFVSTTSASQTRGLFRSECTIIVFIFYSVPLRLLLHLYSYLMQMGNMHVCPAHGDICFIGVHLQILQFFTAHFRLAPGSTFRLNILTSAIAPLCMFGRFQRQESVSWMPVYMEAIFVAAFRMDSSSFHVGHVLWVQS